jgi:hypothetical protein
LIGAKVAKNKFIPIIYPPISVQQVKTKELKFVEEKSRRKFNNALRQKRLCESTQKRPNNADFIDKL